MQKSRTEGKSRLCGFGLLAWATWHTPVRTHETLLEAKVVPQYSQRRLRQLVMVFLERPYSHSSVDGKLSAKPDILDIFPSLLVVVSVKWK
jgi:hypothetical protein